MAAPSPRINKEKGGSPLDPSSDLTTASLALGSHSISAALASKPLPPKNPRRFREERKSASLSPSLRKLGNVAGNRLKFFHSETSREEKEFIQLVLKATPKELARFLKTNKKTAKSFQEVAVAAQLNGLQVCCRYGWLTKAKLLVQEGGFDINFRSAESLYKTPLHFACLFGHGSVIEWLLSLEGIDPTLKDEKGKTAYDFIPDFEQKAHIQELFHRAPTVTAKTEAELKNISPKNISPKPSWKTASRSPRSSGGSSEGSPSLPSAFAKEVKGARERPISSMELKTLTKLDSELGTYRDETERFPLPNEKLLSLEEIQRECHILRSDVLQLKEENYRLESEIQRLQERQDSLLCCSIL